MIITESEIITNDSVQNEVT